MGKCEFSLDHYREILVEAKRLGYSFDLFKDKAIPKDKRVIFMRHDVDGSPGAALDMATLEADLGIRANYFFMQDCPLYRIGSPINGIVVGMIATLGHGVGRHLSGLRRSSADVARKPFNMIEYSIHSPQPDHIGVQTIPINTYDPRFFKDILYISDSRGVWKNGCACEHIKTGKQMQILIHPELWGNTKQYLANSIKTLHDDAASYAKEVFPNAV